MMKRKQILVGILVLGSLLALAVGMGQAQGPEPPEGEIGVGGEVGAAAAVANRIPIQGRLTDASGNPLDGTYTINFYLYDALTGGNLVCYDNIGNNVPVSNGLFTWEIFGNCGSDDITGQQLYLEIRVEGETLSPRQPIYPVPYAFSLKPGAIISGTRDGILTVRSTGTGDRDAFFAYAGDEGEAVEARSTNGIGVYAESSTFVALQAYSYDNTDHPAVFGCSAASAGTCDPYRDDAPAGVFGYGTYGVYGQGGAWGVYGVGTSLGVMGECGSSYGSGGYFHHTDGGLALVADSSAADNDDIVRFRNNYNVKFKVQGDGDVYIDGTYHDSGADFAEMLPAQDGLEPGDVLAIGPDGQLTRSTDPYQTSVIGVYSTRPGFVGGVGDDDDLTGKVPLAILGVVPVKASAENGAIHPGDLLVTASTPGHAMLAGDNPPQGTVLGKALGELEEGTGVIQVLVTLQ